MFPLGSGSWKTFISVAVSAAGPGLWPSHNSNQFQSSVSNLIGMLLENRRKIGVWVWLVFFFFILLIFKSCCLFEVNASILR